MFLDKAMDKLKLVFKIFSQVDECIDPINKRMQPYILTNGLKIVENTEITKDPEAFTDKLLKLQSEISEIIEVSFSNHIRIQQARDESFQEFINKNKESSRNIAIYLHSQFTKGFKQVSEEHIKQTLEEIVKLFCFLFGRDHFIQLYLNLLASRLLNKSTVSDEAEKIMIQLLEVECGHNSVNKLKTMIQDMQKSKNIIKDYQEVNRSGIDFNVEVLTSGQWPYQKSAKITLPKVM